MRQSLTFRFVVIAAVVAFFLHWAYRGVAKGELEQGTDLEGGSDLLFVMKGLGEGEPGSRARLLTEAIAIIQQRIDAYGLKEIVITPVGDDRFSVQISAKDKNVVESIKDLITVLGNLEFRITVEPSAQNYEKYWRRFQDNLKKGMTPDQAAFIPTEDIAQGDNYPRGLRWYPFSDRTRERLRGWEGRVPKGEDGSLQPWLLCEIDAYGISGDSLSNVRHHRSEEGIAAGWVVSFGVKKDWQGSLADLTRLGGSEKFMAIILNGKVDSAPRLRTMLSNSGQIEGSFTEEEAKALAAVLQAGALREKPELVSESTVAAELAGSARNTGLLSTAISFGIVLLLMVWLYFGSGLLANLALLLNLVLIVGVLTWFEAVLTLPGLAGVVLTIGMAVDANILVFERIKEEKGRGRTLAQAIEAGYDRALVTIIDSNLTTLITAYFLFQVGSGPVRGFGITLAVGIVASMFTALYVTRTLTTWFVRRGWMTEARMRGDFTPPAYRWMGMQRTAVSASALAMVAGIVLWEATPEKTKYDLDFTNGSRLVVRFHEEQSLDALRTRLDRIAREDPLFREISVRASAEGIGAQVKTTASRSFELRSQEIATEPEIERLKEKLREAFLGQLLPGPLKATLREEAGGRVAGEIYLLAPGVKTILLEEAFRQKPALGPVTVEALPDVPGAGSTFRLTFTQPPDDLPILVRSALASLDLEEARSFHEARSKDEAETPTAQKKHKERLDALQGLASPEGGFEQCDPIPFADRIDPFTAREHRDAAIRAVALSIAGIIAYVAFRFRSWAFGFAAVIALIHDVVVVLGLVALANWSGIFDARLNLVTVAAFLTLIGYSINDTIVVFDRIRENRGSGGRERLPEIIDRSVNQTLSRTIRTAATTWVVVVTMLVMNFGANSALEGFAFVLVAGVIVGTYSSIFIASPTLVFLPWLWDRCGCTVRGVARKTAPHFVACLVLLLAVDYFQGNLAGDWSKTGFNDVVLALPAGLLTLFLLNFVRFVRLGGAASGTPAAA